MAKINKSLLSLITGATLLVVGLQLITLPQMAPTEETASPSPSTSVAVENPAQATQSNQAKALPPLSAPITDQLPATLPAPLEPVIARSAVKAGDQIITKDGRVFPLRTYRTMLTPNDPSYNQWWVANNGMTQVWDIPAAASPTKIAVIDTGFALEHQEFSGRWAINAGESGSAVSEGPSE